MFNCNGCGHTTDPKVPAKIIPMKIKLGYSSQEWMIVQEGKFCPPCAPAAQERFETDLRTLKASQPKPRTVAATMEEEARRLEYANASSVYEPRIRPPSGFVPTRPQTQYR